MKMLANISAKNSGTIRYRDWSAADDAAWTNYNVGDSIVFGTDNVGSKELRFRVFATQGGYTRDYKVKIVAHMEYADSFKYVALPSQEIFDEAKALRGAATLDGLFVLVDNGTDSKLYMGTDIGATWVEKRTFSSDATITAYEESLYILDGNTLYYGDIDELKTADVSGYDLEHIVGACNDEVYAINDNGNFMVANTEDLATWEEDYVFSNSEDKSEPETEIMETYENEDSKLKMSSKQIREVKSSTQWNTVVSTKYDLVKTLMTMTLNLNLNDSGFGESVAINTLIKNGFIEQQEEE
jgi:hypothetical protein